MFHATAGEIIVAKHRNGSLKDVRLRFIGNMQSLPMDIDNIFLIAYRTKILVNPWAERIRLSQK